MRVFTNAWFGRFCRRQRVAASTLWDAVDRAETGLIDADLGGGVIKQRIARVGESKSKGFRAIVVYRTGDRAFFVYGFSKSGRANIRNDEEAHFKKLAKSILDLSEQQVRQLIEEGLFEEVTRDGQETP